MKNMLLSSDNLRKLLWLVSVVFVSLIMFSFIPSLIAKSNGDSSYRNQNYSAAQSNYELAKSLWFPEKISLRFKDDDLEKKIKKAEIMVRSQQNYEKGLDAFDSKQYDKARRYFSLLAENDPNHQKAQDKLAEISKITPMPIPTRTTQLTTANQNVFTSKSTAQSPKPEYIFDPYYPIVLSLSDNRGGLTKYSSYNQHLYNSSNTGIILKKGDIVRWKVVASDPKSRQILYNFHSNSQRFTDLFGRENGQFKYTTSNEIEFTVTEEDIKEVGETLRVVVQIRSEKENYRSGVNGYDDSTFLDYKLQPN